MLYIKKKLINLYTNPNKRVIYTKDTSTIITRDVIGKTFYVYNGKIWIKCDINKYYYINKPIGVLRHVNTKRRSIYAVRKKKKKLLKKKKKK